MQRYFVNFNQDDKHVTIAGDDFHHIKNVMRMKINDAFYVSNGKTVFYAVIQEINPDHIVAELQYEVKSESELPVHVTIAHGMPKSDKFETVIQKATELGVAELIPVLSIRSLIKLDDKGKLKKIERFEKIVKGAAEQSHRIKIPEIKPFMSLKELIEYSKDYHYKCVAYEASNEDERTNFYRILQTINENEKMIVFIGPEGGISENELALLKENQFTVISLGNRILRTETAPLFIMSAITYELELKG